VNYKNCPFKKCNYIDEVFLFSEIEKGWIFTLLISPFASIAQLIFCGVIIWGKRNICLVVQITIPRSNIYMLNLINTVQLDFCPHPTQNNEILNGS